MNRRIEVPPALTGGSEQQLKQMYSYLFRLSENLNVALTQITVQATAEAVKTVTAKVAAEENGQTSNSYDALKSLIINTANVVRKEMDVLETELNSSYEALSEDWGTYRETISSTITATAEGILQQYGFQSAIETLQEQAAGFSAYQIHTEGYIKQGFIDYDDMGMPVIGIAIGQNLRSTTVTIDGTDYEQFDDTQSCAFYTAEKVSFRIHGQEVAYVSNQKLYIREAEITTGQVSLGGKWMLSTDKGFTIKWLGG